LPSVFQIAEITKLGVSGLTEEQRWPQDIDTLCTVLKELWISDAMCESLREGLKIFDARFSDKIGHSVLSILSTKSIVRKIMDGAWGRVWAAAGSREYEGRGTSGADTGNSNREAGKSGNSNSNDDGVGGSHGRENSEGTDRPGRGGDAENDGDEEDKGKGKDVVQPAPAREDAVHNDIL
jgi:hypothetical protein